MFETEVVVFHDGNRSFSGIRTRIELWEDDYDWDDPDKDLPTMPVEIYRMDDCYEVRFPQKDGIGAVTVAINDADLARALLVAGDGWAENGDS